MVYNNLRGEIRKKFKTQYAFAQKINMTHQTLSRKLCGRAEWTRPEIETVCVVLGIAPGDIYEYFFDYKVA